MSVSGNPAEPGTPDELRAMAAPPPSSLRVPVLDSQGRCCLNGAGIGACYPATCVCGPDLHGCEESKILGVPDGQPDDSGLDPMRPVRTRAQAVAAKIRKMRNLPDTAPVPDPTTWTPAEMTAIQPILFGSTP